MATTKLTAGLLRHIIREELELESQRPASGAHEEWEESFLYRQAQRLWDNDLTAKWPRLTDKVDRKAFEAELKSRFEKGAARRGSYFGTTDMYVMLLDMLEDVIH